MDDIRAVIEAAFERRGDISPQHAEPAVKEAVAEAIALLDSGAARVAEPTTGGWVVNEWLKKAVLLSFRLDDSGVMEGGFHPLLRQGPDQVRDDGRRRFPRRRACASCRRRSCDAGPTSHPASCSCRAT